MKIKLAIIFFLIVSISFAQNEKDSILIKEVFNKYKSAILNDKGSEAVEYLSLKTLAYYNLMLSNVKELDSSDVRALNVIDKIFVLSIRYRTPKEKILDFDSKSLVVYAINNGMVGKNSVRNADIGEVKVEGEIGLGQFVVNGEPAPFYFHFYKENNEWKIDLTSIFEIAETAFEKIIQESGEDDNDFILKLLRMIDSEDPKNILWKPILNKKTENLTLNLKCKDFRKGKFFIVSDSIYRVKINIVRKETSQIEYVKGDEKRIKHEVINWLDDCTYRLKYDENKMELDEMEKWINNNNGLLVKKINITGKCMIYEASLETKEGKTLSQKGKICKE
ncbi:hypothetical protein AAON49_02105 [Pseudotenacibaculum sp. MALMAid0570]|uniref:hypothetical protein n=1 Tax=Pseudotenacibaculum sp. MALMAid0570 TaxID=3143938 RepID=UPI0032E01D2C